MDEVSGPREWPGDIPAFWPLNYALSAEDAWAMVSFLAFLCVPMGAAYCAVASWFGVLNNMPLNDQLHGFQSWLFFVAVVAAACGAAFVGKYLWLVAMCRVLDRVNVGPLVAYGQPRRIGRWDRKLIGHFYRTQGPGLQDRLLPIRPTGDLARLLGVVYGMGALSSAAVGSLPLMRDRPTWPLAAAFGVLALLHVLLGRHKKKQ